MKEMEDPGKATPINRSAMSSSQSTSKAGGDNASEATGIFANALASWDLVPPITPIKRVHRVMPTPSQTETQQSPGVAVPAVTAVGLDSSHQRYAPMPPKRPIIFSGAQPDGGDSDAEDDESDAGAEALSVTGEPVGAEGEASPANDGPTLNVILVAPGENTIQVIKVVRELTGLGLKESKDLVESTPCALLSFLPVADAQHCKEALEEQGALVRLE